MTAQSPVLEQIRFADLEPMPLPRTVLMCPPDYFDVVDVKNPYMEGQQGKVNVSLAKRQWTEVTRAFEKIGVEVKSLPPLPGCEDMVFCANPIIAGLDSTGRRLCLLSHMRHSSRAREVEAHAKWFEANGYQVVALRGNRLFEGCGDAIWQPGRRLIWGGYGYRTDPEIYEEVGRLFDAPVIPLELRTGQFYHLDTCFCPLDEKTALVHPPALTPEALAHVCRMFHCVIEVDAYEAGTVMACNAAPFLGKYVVIQRGAPVTNRRLREHGFEVIEVDTSEYLKSGGSVFCMKMYLF